MQGLGALPFGVAMILVGVGVLALTAVVARLVSKRLQISPVRAPLAIETDLPRHQDGVIVIRPGGRVAYMNEYARQMFGVWEERPSFERLARKARPSDAFVSLCAVEGVAQFSVEGRLLEGMSFTFPNGSGDLMLVSVRPHQVSRLGEVAIESTPRAIQVLTSLGQSMAASLDLEATLYAILESVEQIIPTDFAEITVWDEENQHLIPYRFVGVAGVDRRLETTDERYPLGEGYSGYVAAVRRVVRVDDVDANRELRVLIDRRKYPFRSYLGAPLMVGGELVGTLDLTALEPAAYTENDEQLLRLLAGHAAIALHNALIYREEKRRATELASLASLAQAVSAVRNRQELFARLTEGIRPLLDVEIVGFLLFNDLTHHLEAQAPFLGVPANFTQLYRAEIRPDTPAERVWRLQQPIVATDAAEHQDLIDLGLAGPARAAGIRQTVLVPLQSGGRALGYLQVANKTDGSAFSTDDVRLLSILAAQAAPVIENADLLQQSVARALRSEALRRIAALVGSDADLDEILKFSLIELARLLKADAGAVFFLDPLRNELSAHQASIYGVPPELHVRLGRIPVDEEIASFMVSYSRRAFISDDAMLDQRVLPPYRHLIETLEVRAVIDVPLVYRGRGMGELMLASRRAGHFTRSDIQLASTVANQLAAAVERASLVMRTDETLRRQAEEISQAALLSRDYHTITDLQPLLRRVYQDACNLAGVECGSLVLTDEQGQVTHYEGEEILLPDTLLDVLVVDDYEQPAEDLPPVLRRPPHPGVDSALFVPLAYRDRCLGTLVLHAVRAGHFDAVIQQAVAMLASQAVLAVENLRRQQEQAKRLQQLTQRVQIWQRMLEHLLQTPADTPLPRLLQEIASDVRSLLSDAAVVIGRRDEGDVVRWEAGAGISPDALRRLRQHAVTWKDVQAALQPDYLLLHSYLIPDDAGLPSWLEPLLGEQEGAHVLIHPLQSGAEPQGVMLAAPVSEAGDAQRQNLDLLNDFSRQIARLLEEHRYFAATEQRVMALEKELLRWQERGVRGWFNAARIEVLVDLINRISMQAEAEALLTALGEGMVSALGFDGALMLEAGDEGVPLLRRFGRLPAPEKVNLSTLLGQRNPLQVSLQQRRAIFVADCSVEPEWRTSPLLEALQARAFVCLPLLVHSAAPAALLGIVREPVDEFTSQDEFLFTLLVQQSANALDNLVLLTDTSQQLRDIHLLLDFSRRLSGADEQGVLDNLLESALEIVQPAQAGMVVMAEDDGSLRPRLARGYGRDAALRAVDFAGSDNLVRSVFTAGRARRVGEIDFAVDYNIGQEALLHYQEAVGEKVPLSSLLVPLVSERQTLGVLVLDNFERTDAFPGDEQNLVVSLARQAALALENLLLLETVAQRAAQLQALSQASAVLVAQLEAENLPAALLDTLQSVLAFDAATLWLRQGDELVIRAVRGFAHPEDLIGVSTAVEDSRLFAAMQADQGAIYVPDVRADERFPGTEADRLTWLAAPLATKGEMLGVLVIEKQEADFYSEEQRQVFSTFVNQAAVALQNAYLYRQTLERSQQLDQRARRLARINRFAENLVRSLDVGEIVRYLGDELVDVFPNAGVGVVLQEEGEHRLVYESPAYPDEGAVLALPDAPVFAHLAGTRGVFTTDRAGEEEMLRPLVPWMQSRDVNSLMALPLAVGEAVLGFVLVYSSRGERFSTAEVELVQIFGNQAAVALQNADLFERTRRFTEELEARVEERTHELEREHYRAQSLLRIMRELSASLDLDHVLNRTLAVLNDITGAEQSTILLSRPGENTFYYRAALGYTSPPPVGGRPTSLPVDQGLAGWIYEHRKGVLLHNILEDVRWLQDSEAQPEHRSAIGVPLLVGEEMLGVMLLFHRQPHKFNTDQLEMAQAAANQIAVAINNAELFGLIRQQSAELGEMLRQQQIETSRSRAILEAVADGVMVTDSRGRITLFNDSAGRIMRLQPEQVLGKSLADFRGLFGSATQSWLDQIAAWSGSGLTAGVEDTFADRFTLDDQRVVAVHLAPVFFNQEFLGTVSIFRDITHEVEVDRLKSEFVATVSHELRTPMTSIKGYVEILLMGAAGELTPQQQDFLKVVQANTERLNILVNDLLDVSRIEAGKVHLVMQSLRLQDVIPDEVGEIEHLAQEEQKELHFIVDVPSDLPPVRGDDARVRQIIANLVSNAYHYTPSGGHVWVRAHALDDEVQVDVQDDGIGIPPDEQKRIFERFYRGEDPLVMATAGTGLGLSIVQQLVEMHGGRIWVQSTGVPGEGSIFSFTLPQYHTQRG